MQECLRYTFGFQMQYEWENSIVARWFCRSRLFERLKTVIGEKILLNRRSPNTFQLIKVNYSKN